MVSSSGITACLGLSATGKSGKIETARLLLFAPDRNSEPKPHYCHKRAFGKSCTVQNCARHQLKHVFHGPAGPSHSGARLPTQHAPFSILRPPLPYKGKYYKNGHFLSQPALLQISDWWERDKCRQGRLALYALSSYSQEERFFFYIIMSSSIPLATLTTQSGPLASLENRPSNTSPSQVGKVKHPDAESSAMAASVVADGQSSATTTQSAIRKADLEPWR